MTDSWGDGWNGNVIGLKQEGMMIANFGSNFTSGHEFGPVTVKIPSGISTKIVVYVMGSWRS